MKNKKKVLALISACFLIIVCIFGIKYLFAEHLVYMEEGTSVRFADSYWHMNAVVSQSGNVYIRGALLSEDFTYGIPDVKEYKAQFQSLNFQKTDRFVQIYNAGDASAVMLSNNGGVIITENNEVYVFCELENYQLPSFLCADAVSAKLEGTKVYLLSDEGRFGYIELSSPDDRITVLEGIESFCITDQDHSIWVLNEDHELWVYPGGDLTGVPVLCRSDVLAFDAVSTTSSSEPNAHYQIGIIALNGTAHYYDAWGLPSVNSTSTFEPLPIDYAVEISVYSRGVIVLDQEGNARVFGDDLFSDRTYDGEVVVKNVHKVTVGMLGINFVTNDGHHIYAGSLPSSVIVGLADIHQ